MIPPETLYRVPTRLLKPLLYVDAHNSEPIPVTELAEYIGVTARSLYQSLGDLERSGYVIKRRRPGRATVYELGPACST
jgi:DNA-binding transcriptional ArsR family regulator